jgi:hypothetical protein
MTYTSPEAIVIESAAVKPWKSALDALAVEIENFTVDDELKKENLKALVKVPEARRTTVPIKSLFDEAVTGNPIRIKLFAVPALVAVIFTLTVTNFPNCIYRAQFTVFVIVAD